MLQVPKGVFLKAGQERINWRFRRNVRPSALAVGRETFDSSSQAPRNIEDGIANFVNSFPFFSCLLSH